MMVMRILSSNLFPSVAAYTLSIVCFSQLCIAQGFFEPGDETVLQTTDGMIVSGTILPVSGEVVGLKTDYGTLDIPYSCLHRIDGDLYDAEYGLLREHAVEIQANGDVILETVYPISPRAQGRDVRLLVPGKVLDIADTDGNNLPFLAREQGRLSRCTVQAPEYRLTALVVRARVKSAATIDEDSIQYTYRYTPRSNQRFRLRLVFPAKADLIQATPELVREATNTFVWDTPLQKQTPAVFEVRASLEK